MLMDQVVSVTDLRLKTKNILSDVSRSDKYIFVNNKPKAVLITFEKYEKLQKLYKISELDRDIESGNFESFSDSQSAIDFLNAA